MTADDPDVTFGILSRLYRAYPQWRASVATTPEGLAVMPETMDGLLKLAGPFVVTRATERVSV